LQNSLAKSPHHKVWTFILKQFISDNTYKMIRIKIVT